MTFFRVLALSAVLGSGVLLASGCGGSSTLSGPDSNTSAGLGTLFVRIRGANGSATILLRRVDGPTFKVVRPSLGGKASFYNIPPGRYRVSEGDFSSSGGGQKVEIVADKTLTISLYGSGGSTTPTPFGQ